MYSTQAEEFCKSPESDLFHYQDSQNLDSEAAYRAAYLAALDEAVAVLSDGDTCSLSAWVIDAEAKRRKLKDQLCIACTAAGDVPWLEYLAGQDAAMDGGTWTDAIVPGVGDEPDDAYKRFTYAPGKFETEALAYWPKGHQVQAAEARGRHQALHQASECYDAWLDLNTTEAGFDAACAVALQHVREWRKRVKVWTAAEDTPPPPLPEFPSAEETLKAEQERAEIIAREEEHEKELEAARKDEKKSLKDSNPNAIPDALLRVPGFVGKVMDHCMTTAAYPNRVLAFVGAMSLLCALTARKIRTESNLRTNIYWLALAFSGTGKNHPRQVNFDILDAIGLGHVAKNAWGSGEGIEDALKACPVRLYQTDEIDTILKAIGQSRDGTKESALRILLDMTMAAGNKRHPTRDLAGKPGAPINQPNLIIFGTAVPANYYEALSGKMTAGGLFARMMVFEAGPRVRNPDQSFGDVPEDIIQEARYWKELPTTAEGNLADLELNPSPFVVPCDSVARRIFNEAAIIADHKHRQAERDGNEAVASVWARYIEHAMQLAMLYAASRNPEKLEIDEEAATWAIQVVKHQTQTMLGQAAKMTGCGRIEKLCQKARKILSTKPAMTLRRSILSNSVHADDAREFKSVVDTLTDREQVITWRLTPDAAIYVTDVDALYKGGATTRDLPRLLSAATGFDAILVAKAIGLKDW